MTGKREPDVTLPRVQTLTILELMNIMMENSARSCLLELEGAPCAVRITLEFPKKAANDT